MHHELNEDLNEKYSVEQKNYRIAELEGQTQMALNPEVEVVENDVSVEAVGRK